MDTMKKLTTLFICSYLCAIFCTAEILKYEITIKDHKFIPSIIETTTDSVIKLKLTNLDQTIEEFESFDLKREKIIVGNGGTAIITVGPLAPGDYVFFGEFNPKTAQGKLIVKKKDA
jgi:hypothetical protein